MIEMPSRFARSLKHPWRTAALAVAVVFVGLIIALASVVPFSSETARRKVIEVLSTRLDAEVELTELRFRVLPQFHAEGVGLTIRHRGRRDVPPLISIKRFTAEGSALRLLQRHVTQVQIGRAQVEIPPDRKRDRPPGEDPPGSSTSEGVGRGRGRRGGVG